MAASSDSRVQKPVMAHSLPMSTMLPRPFSPASSHIFVAGMPMTSMPGRSSTFGTMAVSTTTTPPSTTVSRNLSKEGWFSAMSALGSSTSGLPMGSSDKVTEQFAVPPRISGP